MAQFDEPSKLRRVARAGGLVGGAALGGLAAANELAGIDKNYGPDAMREAAPGVLGGGVAGGAAFSAAPPRGLRARPLAPQGVPGLKVRELGSMAEANRERTALGRAANTGLRGLRAARTAVTNPGATARAVSGAGLRAVGSTAGSVLRQAPGAAAAYGNVKGVADSFVDNNTGYADEYAKQMGMDDSAAGVIGASVLRTVENVGNAATGGYAARLGQGIGSALGGGSFSEGWNQTPAREAFYNRRREQQAAASGRAGGGQTAPIDIKFRDESTPPDSFYKNPAPPAKKPETPEDRVQAAAAAGQAARYAAAPDPVQAVGAQDANKAEAAGMRSAARIQDYGANARSTITGNMLDGMRGDTAELQRRMYNDLTSYSLKGFPSLRAARAEMWNNAINSANGATAKGADNAAAADTQGMQDANVSQRAFSERKNKVDMFNVGTSEERRAGDLDRAVTREGNTLRALASGARGADKYADPSFAGKLYEDYLKIYKDPALAAQMANRGAVAAGDTADSPVTAMAQTADADNLQRGMRNFADRWFGFGNRAFDANSAQPVDQAGFWDSILPGGVEYGDLKLRDAQGAETWAPGASLPAGEDFTAFSQRLARQRELARLRNEGK